MRKTINPQPNLREPWLELEHARELETISSLLDAHPKLNELVLQDLRSVTPPAGSDVGRGGMSAEQVLRALLVKQLNQFTYRELAFHLADSRSYRTFCQLGIIEPTPSKSTLAANIKAVKFETLEQINRELVSVAEDAGIEKGRKVRVDCTVVESNIHPPTEPGMFRTQLSGNSWRQAPDSGGESPRHATPRNRQSRAASHRCGQGTRSPVGESS